MTFITKIIISVVAVIGLGGTGVYVLTADKGANEAVHGVAYYVDNEDAREAMLKHCREHPAEIDTPNCVNVEQARHELFFNNGSVSPGDGRRF